MNDITILHNPRCSKSRQTLQLLLDNDLQPKIIEYLKNPPSEEQLSNILHMLGMDDPRQLMRKNEPEYRTLNLDGDKISPNELLRVLHLTPKLIERPIIINGPLDSLHSKATIGRPPENALSILC